MGYGCEFCLAASVSLVFAGRRNMDLVLCPGSELI